MSESPIAKPSPLILSIIVLSQFSCTSIWFASNGIIEDLGRNFALESSALGHLTSAVQLGFISGTLIFALLTLADRFPPARVFFISAVLGAIFNSFSIFEGNRLSTLLLWRFMTGFCLAGIYPVGMKIAADYFVKGLGKSLGFLVGALVIGTAFPHLLKGFEGLFSWQSILLFTSGLALLGGGLMVVLVPNGPYRKPSTQLDLSASFKIFRHAPFRRAALGYFGHMWELYAFWAFVPLMLSTYQSQTMLSFNIPWLSFFIISIGSLGCILGGYLSQIWGAQKIAFWALLGSGLCGLISPLILFFAPPNLFIVFLLIWGILVIADSPLFSTLVAQNAPQENKGSALTIVNCLGFAISIGSIQLLGQLYGQFSPNFLYLFLVIGPLFGLASLILIRD